MTAITAYLKLNDMTLISLLNTLKEKYPGVPEKELIQKDANFGLSYPFAFENRKAKHRSFKLSMCEAFIDFENPADPDCPFHKAIAKGLDLIGVQYFMTKLTFKMIPLQKGDIEKA